MHAPIEMKTMGAEVDSHSASPVVDVHNYTSNRMSSLGDQQYADGVDGIDVGMPMFAARALGQWRGLTGQLEARAEDAHTGQESPRVCSQYV
jgi:hypothetical protein